MEIEINDYISEDEKRQIVIEAFTEQCRNRSAEDFERIISNSAYNVVWQAVDKCLDDNATEMLSEKVVKIIHELSFFSVFQRPDAWDRVDNQAYGVLMDVVRSNKDGLNDALEFGIKNLTRKQKADLAFDAAKLAVSKR